MPRSEEISAIITPSGWDEETVEKGKPQRNKCVKFLIDNWFMLSTIIGVIIGFGAGFGIQQAGLDETGKVWLGKSFINLLINTFSSSNARQYIYSTSQIDHPTNDLRQYYQWLIL